MSFRVIPIENNMEKLILKPPPVGRINLNEAQVIQRLFESEITAPEDRTPAGRVSRFMEEAQELGELLQDKTPQEFDTFCETDWKFSRAVAGETIDTIIIALGILDSLGFDAQNLFNEKININFQKYNFTRMRELRASGLSHMEAQQQAKKEWVKKYPKNGYGDHEYSS